MLTTVKIKSRDVNGKRTGGTTEIEWEEYTFKPKRDEKTGYIVSVAVVVVPEVKAQYWGASACSPEDSAFFDSDRGRALALGRAKQTAVRDLTGQASRNALVLGPVQPFDTRSTGKQLKQFARATVRGVADNAFAAFIAKEYKKLRKRQERGY